MITLFLNMLLHGWQMLDATGRLIFGITSVIICIGIIDVWKWAVWLAVSFIIAIIKSLFGLYQAVRIVMDLVVLVILKFYINIVKTVCYITNTGSEMHWRRKMRQATTYREWFSCALAVDECEGNLDWKDIQDDMEELSKLVATTDKLRNHREQENFKALLYELPGIVKRNHLGIDNYELHARCLTGTKTSVENFNEEVIKCLEFIQSLQQHQLSNHEKIEFFQKLSRNIGHTALCLSGGGSLSMYHMGVIRALIESGNYKHIRVVSGASGGSIPVAMCAVKTEAQLLDEVLVDDVSTDYKRTGDMKRNGIVWFPPLWRQAINFIKTGFLVDNKEYQRTCEFYWGDVTFQEAYAITHKHVCISVTTAASGSSGPRKLLLNHVSTPHVLLRSAVAASCALPGIMAANKLLCKAVDGSIVPFEVDGVDFIDGSVQADVPFRRMSTLFSVSNFIVSQVNIHVLPFIEHKIPGSLPRDSMYVRSMLSAIDLDLRHRSLVLATMGLLPKFYGHDISALFKQKYHGDVTIVPDMKVEESLGVKAIMHPTVKDMQSYISRGRRAAWPHLRRIKHMLTLESAIWTILEQLIADEQVSLGMYGDSQPIYNTADTNQQQSSEDSSVEPRRRSLSHEISVSNLVVYSSPQKSDTLNSVTTAGSAEESSHNEALMIMMSNRIKELENENLMLRKRVISGQSHML